VSNLFPRRLHWLLLISALVIFATASPKPGSRSVFPWAEPSRSSPRPAHHALDQRGRGLFALRQLGIAKPGPLGIGRIHAPDRAGGPRRAGPSRDRITLTTVALALVFAGALGNVHDRIVYGSVVDFIEVHIFSYHWPDFNLADSSIVIGASLLVLDSLLPKKSVNTQHLSS